MAAPLKKSKFENPTSQFFKLSPKYVLSKNVMKLGLRLSRTNRHTTFLSYTSTTPSCGGPLRGQMFQKVFFMSENSVPMVKSVIFGSLGPLLPFSKAYPPKLIKKQKRSKMIFLAVFLCQTDPTCQKLRFYNQKCEFWPLGPLLPFLKGPPNSSKSEIFKNNNFFCFTLSH